MQLHHNPASPFVRKVRVVAHETGLADRIELVPARVSPVSVNAAVHAHNPVGKIPVLVTDDGLALFDSRVICEYLDGLHGGEPLFPPVGARRWTALRRQSIADGLCDAAVAARYERFLRPAELQWADWIEGQLGKVRQAADVLEAQAGELGDDADIGTVAVACALGYLDFRFAEDDWRATRPRLAAWYAAFSERDSLRETVPHELA